MKSKNKNEDLTDLLAESGFPTTKLEEIDVDFDEVVNEELPKVDFSAIRNFPYKKIFNEEGELANPITKTNPYRHIFPNRRTRRAMMKANKQPKNNKKGIRLIVTRVGNEFVKTKVVKQFISTGYGIGVDLIDIIEHKRRTLTHNLIQ
jgi:hypothetical protein